MEFETLSRLADDELKAVIKILPDDVQQAALACAISLEDKPGKGEFDDTLEGDELGLFEGTSLMDEPGPEDMPKIRLFLENIWDWTGADEQDYLDEVGTTFLHELGHYLGWDEDEVSERGLE